MTEDIIRIDGVEYEIVEWDESYLRSDMWYGMFRPKRKQTGWICRSCCVGTDGCLKMFMVGEPRGCLGNEFHSAPRKYHPNWQPFYGKVVE